LTNFLGTAFCLEPSRDDTFSDALQIEIERRAQL
jgi:hypothetical protein